jgi:hypothetical protein
MWINHATAKEGTTATNKNIRANVPFLIYSTASPTRCTRIFYVFFIALNLLYIFRVLFVPIMCIYIYIYIYYQDVRNHDQVPFYNMQETFLHLYGTMIKCLFIICKERFYTSTEPWSSAFLSYAKNVSTPVRNPNQVPFYHRQGTFLHLYGTPIKCLFIIGKERFYASSQC